MFPPFINSFGDQVTAVLINSIGTILAGVLNAFYSNVITTIVAPILKSFAAGLGIGTT